MPTKGKRKEPVKKGKPTEKDILKDEYLALKVWEAKPSNLMMVDKCSTRYFKWITSQLQTIIDLNIHDCNVI